MIQGKVEPGLIREHIHNLVGIRHAETRPSGLNKALGYLKELFERYGLRVRQEKFDPLGALYPNIIGILPGQADPDKIWIIGAHYDTVSMSPGADDNASGLSVMLEAARVLCGLSPPCTIEFAGFSMEEQGLLGSCAYVRGALQSGKEILGALILESVGFTAQGAGSQRFPKGLPIAVPDVGNFIGIIGNRRSENLCRAFVKTIEIHSPELPKVSLVVPGNGEVFPDVRRSDHAAFWDQGLPALMITDTADFRNPHYHQPTDLPETLDLDFMARIAQALAAFGVNPGSSGQIGPS